MNNVNLTPAIAIAVAGVSAAFLASIIGLIWLALAHDGAAESQAITALTGVVTLMLGALSALLGHYFGSRRDTIPPAGTSSAG